VKYHIENFGCQMNEHDMEKVASLLHAAGIIPAEDVRAADVVIVNTCCVREKAEQKFYSLMGRLKHLKRKNGTILGMTGCIAQLEKDAIVERLPFLDFSLGPSSLHRITEAIDAAAGRKRFLEFADNGCDQTLHVRPRAASGAVKAYVTVMKGCDNFCSYCIVPYVRGREVSRESADVIDEVRNLAVAGVKEVTLLGQNVNSYNRGRDDLSFPELLNRINAIDGIERIRFVTSHPKDMSDNLVDCFGRLEKLCEHIHLPFQSGSDRILGLMNRGYTAAQYLEKVDALRERCPGMAFSADCIVGFPGETEEDFEGTMALIEKVRFDGLFSFCYSPRKNTAATGLPDEVDQETAHTRLLRLQAAQKVITREKNRELEGSTVEVLVEGRSKNSPEDLTGRTRTNKIVNFGGAEEMVGRLAYVEVVKGYANSLKASPPTVKEVASCSRR
jgi:tRNA-2-methylthio-N6-dimethylallyladenosine synthase